MTDTNDELTIIYFSQLSDDSLALGMDQDHLIDTYNAIEAEALVTAFPQFEFQFQTSLRRSAYSEHGEDMLDFFESFIDANWTTWLEQADNEYESEPVEDTP